MAHGTPCVGITGTSMTPMQFVGNSTSLGHQVQCQIAHLDLVQLQGWNLVNIAISSVEEVKQDYKVVVSRNTPSASITRMLE